MSGVRAVAIAVVVVVVLSAGGARAAQATDPGTEEITAGIATAPPEPDAGAAGAGVRDTIREGTGEPIAAESLTRPDGGVGVNVTAWRKNTTAFVYQVRFHIPPAVDHLEFHQEKRPANLTGFRVEGDALRWDGRSTVARVRYVYEVGPGKTSGVANVAGLLAAAPDGYVTWRVGGDRRTVFFENPPESGEWDLGSGNGTVHHGTYLYLGDRVERTVTADGARIRVVVPADGDGTPGAAARARLLRLTARELDVDDDPGAAVGFVVPDAGDPVAADGLDLDLAGKAKGQAFWVREWAGDATWIHEYVHTNQEYWANDSMRWLTEATAEYYGNLYATRFNASTWTAYERRFRPEVTTDADARGVLSRPGGRALGYTKGERVVAALDLKIRAATDGNHTLEDVLRRIDRHNTSYARSLTVAGFQRHVEAVAGRSFDRWIDRYVTTEAVPPVPDAPGRYAVLDVASVTLPSTVEADGGLIVRVTVTNTDDAPWNRTVGVRVGGSVAERRVRVAAGATRTVAVPLVLDGEAAGLTRVRIRAGLASANRTVRVEAGRRRPRNRSTGTATGTATPDSGPSIHTRKQPGLSALVALLGVLGAVLVAIRRR